MMTSTKICASVAAILLGHIDAFGDVLPAGAIARVGSGQRRHDMKIYGAFGSFDLGQEHIQTGLYPVG